MSCKNEGLFTRCKDERLLNDPENAVTESLRGIAMVNTGLVILDGCNALLRRDYCSIKNKVRIISGGASGNEPTHSGFVGPGMLTGAMFGDINSAPTVDSIYKVMVELGTNHDPGLLVIVQQHPGYILNFTLAKIRALKDGIQTSMLSIEDEANLTKSSTLKPRGLLGTLFVHKIAGAMADAGYSLADIYKTCNRIAKENISSIGICTSIKTPCSNNMKHSGMELGYGIHGEPGKRKIDSMTCRETVSVTLRILLESRESFSKTNELAVIINNLGGCSQLESNIFIMEILEQLSNFGYRVWRVYTGTLMSSVHNKGLHVSLLSMPESDVLEYLDAPTLAPSWPKIFSAESLGLDSKVSSIVQVGEHVKNDDNECPMSIPDLGPAIEEYSADAFCAVVIFACEALIACANQVDIIDQDGGDGDCGTSLAKGAKAIKKAVEKKFLRTVKPAVALSQISWIIQKTMPGFQGGLYSVFFYSAAKAFATTKETNVTPALWLKALGEANNMMSDAIGVKEGDRSTLDSLLAAEKAFRKHLSAKQSPIEAFSHAVKAAEEKAIYTTYMEANVGRASLIEKQKFQHPDAGAHAVGIWLRATYEGIKLKFSDYS